MHKVGVIHRDIRPSNIWFSSIDKCYKFGGFSEAKFIERKLNPL
jgi:serine/threonine protein kinase